MKVQCESCRAEYNIDEARIPLEGLQIKCPRCMSTFIAARSGGVPETAGDLFDLEEPADGGYDPSETLELDLPRESGLPEHPPRGAFDTGPVVPSAASGSSLPPVGESTLPPVDGESTRPSMGGGSTLPPIARPGGESASAARFDSPAAPAAVPPPPKVAPKPAPSQGAEGEIFDFIDNQTGDDRAAASEAQVVRYRIRRQSGKVFGPFDEQTVRKMLAEQQLMGNEEASIDGRTFKPLDAFDEFAELIRRLMDEPVAVVSGTSPSAASVSDAEDEAAVHVEVAPKGLEFAEPPARVSKRKGLRAGPLIGLSLLALVVAAGIGLEWTEYGYFGHRLLTGSRGSAGGDAGGGATDPAAVAQSRSHYFQDTHAGYMALIKALDAKAKEGDADVEALYLLGLSYAALLRNYGANAVYLQRGREILKQLVDLAPDSPQQRKVDGALSIPTDFAHALSVLQPLIAEGSRDKEALYLAGWATAYEKKWQQAVTYFERCTAIDPGYAKAYHALGDLHALQGDFDAAWLHYEKALKNAPEHISSAVELARIAIEVRRKPERGGALLKTAFGKHSGNLSPTERAKALHLRALLAIREGEREQAVRDLTAAVEQAPARVEFRAALGSYYLDLGEYAKAEQQFATALSKDPDNVDALVGKGRALWKNGDIVKAKILFQNTGKQAPQDPRPAFYLGGIAQDLQQLDEAAKHYERAIKIAPNFLLGRVALSRLRLKHNDLRGALAQLTKARKLDAQSAIVRTGLGEVYLKKKNLRMAEIEFRESLRLDPELAAAHFNLATTLREQKKYAQAAAEYEKTASIAPRYPDLALERGYNLYLQGAYREALAVFEAAIRHSSAKDDRLYVRAGLAAKAVEQIPDAIKYFQSAVGLNNGNSEAYFQLGLLFQARDEHDQALDLLKQAAKLDADNAEIRYRMGLSYLATEMIQDAIDEFRAAIKRKANHVDALVELGNALVTRYQFAEAVKCYKRVVAKKPERADVMLALGEAYTNQGLYNKALGVLKKAVAKNPRSALATYRLARAYDELNKKTRAIKLYQRAIQLNPQDPMPHFYLGHVFKAINQNRQALTSFKRYLQLKPDAPDADELREEMYYLEQDL